MKRPNLLYIFTDQQRADTLACYGNQQIEAPALNGLAAESCVFERAYVSQPVCSPARATMMTGLWPHAAGVPACNVPLAADIPTIADYLAPTHDTAFMGKWHLGDEIFPQHGFAEWVGTEDSYRHSYARPEHLETLSPYHHFLLQQGYQPDAQNQGQAIFSRHVEACMPEAHTKAAYLGERAAQYIGQRGEQPFVLCVSYLEPHPPHTGPLDNLYDPATLPTGPAFRCPPGADTPLMVRLMSAYYSQSEEYGLDLRDEAGWRALMARYWGNITLVDRSVGRILRALEESGQADNTIVVFTSDHGEMMGDHGLLGKTLMHEESVRVPLLLRDPRLGGGQRRIEGAFSHIDLLPTLLDLTGQSVPGNLPGRSRVGVLEGRDNLADNDVIIQWNGSDGQINPSLGEAEVNRSMGRPCRTLISVDWKLNLYDRGMGELYNLQEDPHELENLWARDECRGRIEAMTAQIKDWQVVNGDAAEVACI